MKIVWKYPRGHPLSTYAPRGRGGSKKTENMRTLLTDRLREKRTRGGEGVKKAGKSAYVLNGCSLVQQRSFEDYFVTLFVPTTYSRI